MLIGGTGRDWIFGQGGDDILIGGTTAHDASPEALDQILSIWGERRERYGERIDGLDDGLLNETTIIDDEDRDFLFGQSGRDWFFEGDRDILDDRCYEQVVELLP